MLIVINGVDDVLFDCIPLYDRGRLPCLRMPPYECLPAGSRRPLLFLHSLQALRQHWDNLVKITHYAEVSNAEDGCKLVLVDSDD